MLEVEELACTFGSNAQETCRGLWKGSRQPSERRPARRRLTGAHRVIGITGGAIARLAPRSRNYGRLGYPAMVTASDVDFDSLICAIGLPSMV
jgi:hypothetical protein